ncbi:MAG: histidine--tRNA ligase [Halothiobacillus sp. 24-54-40]|jgi:histidyl-tRNA synthetase|nr:MAG: histidine--tRNA ligase [Halothiobacillus sp. 35-54-62]OYZ87447.1 MAG: histidine--tRNA ligase [Halothiobacillus sp. 24-54-40]OZA80555.1 MAG: histidine--tRNA ligase [Halothiobacillus sp. 39-53-45]HQS02576.1 histidine--tRNA ligase [Halothiobacillus sp.]HQS28492.1 histidine--tRNA ligase [Halothiobacillus sp.]
MSKTLQTLRGMHDVLPAQTLGWSHLESVLANTARRYGYQEIRMPIVEHTALFTRGIGEVTDIVEKEMYSFIDRNGDALTLRPEGTASCVRACLEHGLIHNQQRKLWYIGPMFRHERPQKGRYRQFHQFGVEAFGVNGAELDVELMLMAARIWQQLGITEVELQINTLGNADARAAHRSVLIAYLQDHREQLDDEARARLETNPLRILDSKNPAVQTIVAHAPALADYLDEADQDNFAEVQTLLTAAGIPFVVNPRLVRGLDYYNRTVFEWVTHSLGAQGTLCAGGRYDGLVAQLGGKATPAAGFALGLERLIELSNKPENDTTADIYVLWTEPASKAAALNAADALREALPSQRVQCALDGGGLKNQLRRADRSGAAFTVHVDATPETPPRWTIKALRNAPAEALINNTSMSPAEGAAWLLQTIGAQPPAC